MNPGEEEAIIVDELLQHHHHGKNSKKTSSSSTTKNTNEEKSSHYSHGKNRKKNSKRKREEKETESNKKKKSKFTSFESQCYGFDGVGQSGEPHCAANQFGSLQGQVDLNPVECLTEACMKYELLRDNYQNLRHSYLHLKRRYNEGLEMQMSLNRKKSPGEIQELEGVVDPLMTSPVTTIQEVEKDPDGTKWQLKFLETDSKTWRARWERL